MKIIQKVLIKQKVTKSSKRQLKDSFTNQKMQLEQECQQLLFEQRKTENKTNLSKQDVAHRFQQEITIRKEKMKSLDFKIDQLDLLEIGSEIVEKEVEALVEVEEGMHWEDVVKKKSIVIQDGVVVRIDH